LREAVPDVRRLGILANVASPASALEESEVEAAARKLGLDVLPVGIRRAEEIVPAFMTLKDRAEALYVCGDALITNNRIRIVTLALGARLATMYPGARRRRGLNVIRTKLSRPAPAGGGLC
jgi:putative tryptophan/tyrosine transport system substrate-binding protein